jgi:hypothetical protein
MSYCRLRLNNSPDVHGAKTVLMRSCPRRYKRLLSHDIPLSPKSFAVGFRIEHPQVGARCARWGTWGSGCTPIYAAACIRVLAYGQGQGCSLAEDWYRYCSSPGEGCWLQLLSHCLACAPLAAGPHQHCALWHPGRCAGAARQGQHPCGRCPAHALEPSPVAAFHQGHGWPCPYLWHVVHPPAVSSPPALHCRLGNRPV